MNVLPPIEARASCFNENSVSDSDVLRRVTLSTGVDFRAAHGILRVALGRYSPGFLANVYCGILVPIMVTAAIGTIPFPHKQVLGPVILVAANMAKLAAWMPLAYLDKLFALPGKLILQHAREHVPAIVGYGFAKAELCRLSCALPWL